MKISFAIVRRRVGLVILQTAKAIAVAVALAVLLVAGSNPASPMDKHRYQCSTVGIAILRLKVMLYLQCDRINRIINYNWR